jgi:hypothetical protein
MMTGIGGFVMSTSIDGITLTHARDTSMTSPADPPIRWSLRSIATPTALTVNCDWSGSIRVGVKI